MVQSQDKRGWILLPALNEEVVLPILMNKFQSVLGGAGIDYRVVVCDDGSTDGTLAVIAELSKGHPLEAITHIMNRGLGETSRDLFEFASCNADVGDVIVRMDCDDTHDPSVILAMLGKIDQGNDVVIASRFQPGGRQTGFGFYRRMISRLANWFMKFFFPLKGVHDYSSGFRAYRAEMVKRAIDFYGNNFRGP